MWSVEGALPQWARRDSTVNDNSVLANASPGPLLIVASRLLRHLLRHLLSRLLGRLCYCVKCHRFFHLLLLFLTLLLLVVF